MLCEATDVVKSIFRSSVVEHHLLSEGRAVSILDKLQSYQLSLLVREYERFKYQRASLDDAPSSNLLESWFGCVV